VAGWTPEDDRDPFVRLGKLAIGAAVRSARLDVGTSQRRFAVQAGVDQSVISRLETGKLNGIRWQTLARIIGVVQAMRGFRLPRDLA
jgi:predicted transcriptional regulator